ncbi:hypothetical protein LA080_012252 [Diaporthe eres]|nr:hypothetical protein LA080_012252 [Diaporthe eres]
MASVNTYPPTELARLVSQAGVAKSRLSYLVIASGCPGLGESNPALATMIAGFTFPLGFVLIMLTNMELVTSNMLVMPFTWFQRKITLFEAEGRVNVQWSANFLRDIGCNWFVALASFLSLGSVEFVSKIYCIWIPIWAFVILG